MRTNPPAGGLIGKCVRTYKCWLEHFMRMCLSSDDLQSSVFPAVLNERINPDGYRDSAGGAVRFEREDPDSHRDSAKSGWRGQPGRGRASSSL